jgi:ATP-dependent Clp protease protease subunit
MTTEFKARGTSGEIWLYDQVGESFWGEGISAKQFQKELTAMGKVASINLHINSPGGDVFDGLAIYNQLKSHPARVVVDVDGLAASIASVIAMAGDEIRMASNAMMMIHNPHGMAVGDSTEMQRVAALLGQVKGSLSSTYAARTGQKPAQLDAWMDDETWMSADTAVQYGFADAITSAQSVSACFNLLTHYRNVPKALTPALVESDVRAARDMRAVRIARNKIVVDRITGQA